MTTQTNTTEAARLPSFNFLEEFAKFKNKQDPNRDQIVPIKVVRTMPVEPPVQAPIQQDSVVAPSELDLAQLAELVKLIFRKVSASTGCAIATESEINEIMQSGSINIMDKFVLASYLRKLEE